MKMGRGPAPPTADALPLLLLPLLLSFVRLGAAGPPSLLEQSRRTLSEERGHFEHWCNGTLAAQDGRRTALRQLLSQAQVSTAGDVLQQIAEMSREAGNLAEKLEVARLAEASASRSRHQRLEAARLDAEDAAHDVEALGRAQDAGAGPKVFHGLLEEARGTRGKLQATVELLQQARDATSSEVVALEVQYNNKQSGIEQLQHQYFTAQRSLEVLTAAIEDESSYLADLESMCSIGQQVYIRLASDDLVTLEKATTELAAPPMPQHTPSAPTALRHDTSAAPQTLKKSAKPKVSLAMALKSLPVAPPMDTTATPAHVAAAKPPAKADAPPRKPPLAATAMPTHTASMKKPVESHAAPSASAAAASKASHVAPTTVPKAKLAAHPTVPPSAAALAGYDLSDDDDDAAAAAAPAPPPAKQKAAPMAHTQPAAAKTSSAAPVQAKPAARAQSPPATTGVSDDDDDNEAHAAPPSAVSTSAVPVVHRTTKAHAAAPMKPAAMSSAKVAAPAAVQAPPAQKEVTPQADALGDADEVSVPPPPKKKHTGRKATHAKKAPNAFMDGVYSSAAGAMPSAYTAWTPDGAAASDHSSKAMASVSASDAKKRMSAMFDSEGTDEGVLASATPVAAVAASSKAAHSVARAAEKVASAAQSPAAPAAKAVDTPAVADSSGTDDSSAGGDVIETITKPVVSEHKHSRRAAVAKTSQLQVGKSGDDDIVSDGEGDGASKKDGVDDAGALSSLDGEKSDDAAVSKAKDTSASVDDLSDMDEAPKPKAKAHKKTKHMLQDPDADSGDDAGVRLADTASQDVAAAPAKPTRQLSEGEKAAQAFGYDLSDDDDDASAASTPAPVHRARHKKKAHKKRHVNLDSDGDEQPSPPVAQPMAHSDADPLADDAAPPAKKHSDSTDFDLGGSSDATSTAAVVDAPPAKRMAKQLDDGSGAPSAAVSAVAPSGSRVPGQYTAWTPSDAASAAKQKQAMLSKMESEFDSDDDGGDATTTPPTRRHHGHKKAVAVVAQKVEKDDDGVVYDDDDLPNRGHKSIADDLQGGWQALMKKTKVSKSKKPKLDPDIAIMQSLYSDDGALPSQYSAWSPNQAASSQATPTNSAKAASSGQDDSQDDDDSDDSGDSASFFQLSSVPDFAAILEDGGAGRGVQAMSELIGDAVHGSGAGSSPWFGASAFLERSEFRVDTSRVSAAHGLLQQYADVLKSSALRQLARARPSPPKLAALSKRLSAVDPLVHPGAAAALKREEQAEQWCLYFEKHQQSVAPMQKALAQLENANVKLSNVSSQRAAVGEEVDARTQLEKAIEQDVQGLSGILTLLQRAAEGPGFGALEASAAAAGEPSAKALLDLGAATASWHGAHMELVDLVRAALRSRSSTLKVQRARLQALQEEAAEREKAVSKEQAEVSSAQGKVGAIRSKLSKIGATCEATLTNLERRRHAGHMEAHAVDMAVKVLGGTSSPHA